MASGHNGVMDNDYSFKKFLREYLNEAKYCSRLSQTTLKKREDFFCVFMRLMPEICSLQDLSLEIIVEFFRRLETRVRLVGANSYRSGIKDSTIRTYRGKLNSFFEWLRIRGHIRENPLSRLKQNSPIYNDSKALHERDIRQIYSAIVLRSKNQFILRRDTVMVSILYFCGLRLGEFIDLSVHDFDLENKILTVVATHSKSKRTRYIPLHPTLIMHLKDYLAARNKKGYKTSKLITSTIQDAGLSRYGLKHWVQYIGTKSGIRFHLHQFRHTFACNLASKDVNVVKIQRLLGHSSLNMTMLYLRSMDTSHLYDEISKLSI